MQEMQTPHVTRVRTGSQSTHTSDTTAAAHDPVIAEAIVSTAPAIALSIMRTMSGPRPAAASVAVGARKQIKWSRMAHHRQFDMDAQIDEMSSDEQTTLFKYSAGHEVSSKQKIVARQAALSKCTALPWQ